MSFQQKEREKLAQLMLEVGPDAPTLCKGWTTKDLAVHLFIRENRTHLAGGYMVPALKPITESAEEKEKARPYEEIVKQWAAGPPLHIKPLDKFMNISENFIHHEDVRRGELAGLSTEEVKDRVEPREFSDVVDKKLMSAAAMMGKLALTSVDVPVILTPPNLPPVTLGGKRGVAEKGDRVVRVKGEPGELLLWVTGRDAVKVEIEGNAGDIAKVKRAV
ncbi:TIGR03085 family metal-binding protein [Corynebacterium aquatimens]|uniref:Uncharacterized protein (TIGR03085 family) n=1 Tax=Corynebacterium aquatimens TaxID=1190508 RepID=A0A931E029_9CORY|nr:TIGR03085 family metal-binding protein [Corynebacterium aquatimens]MBG6121823.1 uncharacterized protein (TIGR03085 family) [Corynebacterium aquatimens]WJY65639.1 hypothetical protein CAQUA_04630 [Corynebacterium aquatimens]